MDYIVGSVAALISGNVTPNRPKLIRRALTPTKHQQSPNVTPKSEFVEDRSIFLSPTLQKKKAIVKKSPKRIFQNPDLDSTEDCEGNTSTSPKADKVKKHLKDDLDVDVMAKKKSINKKSLNESPNKSSVEISPKKKAKNVVETTDADNTPKKKKKRNSESNVAEKDNESLIKNEVEQVESVNVTKSPKKTKQRRKSTADYNGVKDEETNTQTSPKKSNDNQVETEIKQNKKKNKKRKKNKMEQIKTKDTETNLEEVKSPKKKKGKKNKSKEIEEKTENMETENQSESDNEQSNIANPNAITEKDTDSEHDSDNEIESENEEDTNIPSKEEDNPSSDEEESSKSPKKKEKAENKEQMSEEEVKRTLFVGNVPFSSKCKKEIKKIFSKFGQIETIRIRTIPVKDARVTPKLAVIKNELHPERSTVNVYVKYADEVSVSEALSENNTVLNNHHLRVSRSISTGAEHDPKLAVFVGNLPFAIEDETLRAKFEGCGEIESVRVVRDKKTNAGKGFGYVNFATKDGVELALAMTEEDLTIKNRILRVNRCTQSGSKGLRKPPNQKFGGKFGGNQNRRQNEGRSQGKAQRWNQDRGNQDKGFQGKGRFQNKGFQNRGNQGGFQGRGNQDRGNQGRGIQFKGNQRNQEGKSWAQKEETGAARRLMNKRKLQDAGEGPSNKKPNISKEKKPKKEFVGMTAEKKKKQKFNKDAKKKKALSEILTKK